MERNQFEKELISFCNNNSSQWEKNGNKECKDFCLIDGFALWPTSINEVARVGKVIEKKYDYKPLVIFNKKNYFQKVFENMFSSYGINDFLLLRNFQFSVFCFIKTVGLFFIFLFSNFGKKILSYNLNGIEIGKIIYDSALAGKIRIKSIQYYRLLLISFITFAAYEILLRKYNVKYAVLADKEYITQGILFHMLIKKNIPVLVSGTNRIKAYDLKNENESFLHPGLPIEIIREKNSITSEAVLIHINNRMSGKFSQHDIQNAYKNKRTYSREELCKLLKLDKRKPNVFIFPHVFSDCPHNSSYLLFEDYSDWFSKLMKTIVNNTNINIIVKPHPSAYIYGEEDSVLREIKKISSKNINLCPADFNNQSLADCCDLIITCQGTIALEMACMGIPSLVAGAGYYNGYDIVKEFSTAREYLEYIKNLRNEIRQKLSDSQVNDALQVYYYIYETSIIDKLYPDSIVHANDLKYESDYLQVMVDNLKKLSLNLNNPENNLFCEIVKDCC